jgi:hypothetical protein
VRACPPENQNASFVIAFLAINITKFLFVVCLFYTRLIEINQSNRNRKEGIDRGTLNQMLLSLSKYSFSFFFVSSGCLRASMRPAKSMTSLRPILVETPHTSATSSRGSEFFLLVHFFRLFRLHHVIIVVVIAMAHPLRKSTELISQPEASSTRWLVVVVIACVGMSSTSRRSRLGTGEASQRTAVMMSAVAGRRPEKLHGQTAMMALASAGMVHWRWRRHGQVCRDWWDVLRRTSC